MKKILLTLLSVFALASMAVAGVPVPDYNVTVGSIKIDSLAVNARVHIKMATGDTLHINFIETDTCGALFWGGRGSTSPDSLYYVPCDKDDTICLGRQTTIPDDTAAKYLGNTFSATDYVTYSSALKAFVPYGTNAVNVGATILMFKDIHLAGDAFIGDSLDATTAFFDRLMLNTTTNAYRYPTTAGTAGQVLKLWTATDPDTLYWADDVGGADTTAKALLTPGTVTDTAKWIDSTGVDLLHLNSDKSTVVIRSPDTLDVRADKVGKPGSLSVIVNPDSLRANDSGVIRLGSATFPMGYMWLGQLYLRETTGTDSWVRFSQTDGSAGNVWTRSGDSAYWATSSGGSGTTMMPYPTYRFDASTVDADPGSGDIRFNSATPASVTILYVDDATILGEDAIGLWNVADTGYVVTIQGRSDLVVDASQYRVTGKVDASGYWKINVTVLGSGILPTANDTLHMTIAARDVRTAAGTLDSAKVAAIMRDSLNGATGMNDRDILNTERLDVDTIGSVATSVLTVWSDSVIAAKKIYMSNRTTDSQLVTKRYVDDSAGAGAGSTDSVYVLYQVDVAGVASGYKGLGDTVYVDTADATGGAGSLDSAKVAAIMRDSLNGSTGMNDRDIVNVERLDVDTIGSVAAAVLNIWADSMIAAKKIYMANNNTDSQLVTKRYVDDSAGVGGSGSKVKLSGQAYTDSVALKASTGIAITRVAQTASAPESLKVAFDSTGVVVTRALRADSSTKALGDASGNTITSTYETITNVAKIGDDTTSLKAARDSVAAWDNGAIVASNYLSLAGGSMTSNADVTFSGGGDIYAVDTISGVSGILRIPGDVDMTVDAAVATQTLSVDSILLGGRLVGPSDSTFAKVADGSITGGTAGSSVKIAAATITAANLATSVAGAGLQGGAGTALIVGVDSTLGFNAAKPDSLTVLNIPDGSVDSNKINPNSVLASELADAAVDSGSIAVGAVRSIHMATMTSDSLARILSNESGTGVFARTIDASFGAILDIDSVGVDTLVANTRLKLPTADNPNMVVVGQLAYDSNDSALVGTDGTVDYQMASMVKMFSMTIDDPDGLANDTLMLLSVEAAVFPFGITITGIGIATRVSTTYDVGFAEYSAPATRTNATDTISTAATLEASETAITDAALDAGDFFMAEFPDTDDLTQLTIWFTFYVNTGN